MEAIMRLVRIEFLLTITLLCNCVMEAAMANGVEAPVCLTCEYLVNPLGIDESRPRLAWQVSDSSRGAVQTAYQILVSGDSAALDKNEGDVWDSGKVDSSQCIQIVYTGKQLQSGARYYWKVRTWDADGKASPYSKTSFWLMGRLGKWSKEAMWIGLGGPLPMPEKNQRINTPSPMLRRSFDLPSNVKRASISVTGLGLYELHVNGERIGKNILAPEWTDYDTRIQYQTYDVTEQSPQRRKRNWSDSWRGLVCGPYGAIRQYAHLRRPLVPFRAT